MTLRERLLFLLGLAAGPLFTISWLIEGSLRPDYSNFRHPVSSLSIGSRGWVQELTFIVSGLLLLAFAVGLYRVLTPQGLSKWCSIYMGSAAIGLIGAGFFLTDPMNGYPPGTVPVPTEFTVAGRLHRLFSALFFLGIPLAAFTFAKWFARNSGFRWARYSRISGWSFLLGFVVTTIAFLQVGPLENIAGLLQRITITIGWAWVTLVAFHFFREIGPSEEYDREVKDGAA